VQKETIEFDKLKAQWTLSHLNSARCGFEEMWEESERTHQPGPGSGAKRVEPSSR